MFVKPSNLMRGFTLLEVMIAVLVFSIGLLGVAGMVLASMRGTHTAQLRTQASFLAQWIGDSMRANPIGVMAGNYEGTAPNGGSTVCTAGCTAAQTAARDRERWGAMLATALPAGQGVIACDLNSPVRPSDGLTAFPAGLCTLTLTWSESTETEKVGASNAAAALGRRNQRFDWVFNP